VDWVEVHTENYMGDGGYDLHPYPGIGRWLARVAGLPRHRPLEAA